MMCLKCYAVYLTFAFSSPSECSEDLAPSLLFGIPGIVADWGNADDEGNESSRTLGLVVARGTLLVLVSPVDGSEEIANPFIQQEE
jgi:hypothetical protein